MAEDSKEEPLGILQLMSCRGWNSDAWAAVSLTLGLQELGHNVILVCRKGEGKGVAERASNAGVQRVMFLSFRTGFAPKAWIYDIRGIVERWRRDRIQILHAHRGQDHWLAAAARRLIAGTHSRPPALIRSRHILQPVRTHWLNRWLYNHATAQTVTATETIRRGYMKTRTFQESRFITLRGGVDTRVFRPGPDSHEIRAQFKIPDGEIVFGMSSRFIPLKGHMDAVDALARLRKDRGLPARLMMAGSGGDHEKVAVRAAELGIEDAVHFLGFRNDLPAALSAADAGLFAARSSEGTSRAVLEWMALGKPVVATDVGCVRELLEDGAEGLVVPPEDPSALAGAMERIVRNSDLRRQLGAASRARAESEYDRLVWTRKWVGVYRSVLGQTAAADDPGAAPLMTERAP